MKVFIVFRLIILHILLGYVIACPQGLKGTDCDEKECTMQCNTGNCVWRNGTAVCACEEGKWTGPNCEEPLPCAMAKCGNHGRCVPYNSTLLPFICICNDGYKGDRCDEPIIDLCIGQSKISCENDAKCENNKCVCNDGFGGENCENRVPMLAEYKIAQCNPSCASVFANKKCDKECNTAECFYDGLDCFEKPELDDGPYEDKWIDPASSAYCLKHYGNDICDKDCNSRIYGFDGGDCEKELRGTVKRSRIQISLGVNPTVLNLSHKFLVAYLAQILRAGVSISRSQNEHQPEVFSVVAATGAEERIALDDSLPDQYTDFTKLILDVDSSFCHNKTWHCLRLNGTENNIQSAIILLNTVFVRSEQPLSFPSRSVMVHFNVKEITGVEEPSAAWIEIFLAVLISMLLTLLMAVVLIACWIVRRRRCSKTSKGGERRHRWIDHHKNRLVAAVEEGNISSLTSLLSEVTPIEAANAEDVAGNTVLHVAAARDDKEVVQLLLHSRMFDVCSVNSIGQSPLLYALREGKPGLETLTLLVNAINDAKIRQRATGQNTRAATTSHLMLTALSEEPGWGLTDAVGRSALHHAALAGRPRHVIHFLVSHGASPGLQDASGNTPLHLAAINGHTETVNALLEERSAVTVTNSLGNTPAKVCSLNGHSELAAMLFEKEHAVLSAPMRSRHDSQRGAMYSTVESVYGDDRDELVLPSLLSFGADLTPLMASTSGGDDDFDGCAGGGAHSLSGLGSGSLLRSEKSDRERHRLSGSVDALSPTTPTPRLPHILTPSAQLVEVSPERPPSTLPRKCLYGVERSPSDPRPSQLTTPYGTVCGGGKRRSLPDGPSLTANYRDVLLSPAHLTYATNTMSTASERSQSSAGHESSVSSFRPPPLS